jgi:hypothetical protein
VQTNSALAGTGGTMIKNGMEDKDPNEAVYRWLRLDIWSRVPGECFFELMYNLVFTFFAYAFNATYIVVFVIWAAISSFRILYLWSGTEHAPGSPAIVYNLKNVRVVILGFNIIALIGCIFLFRQYPIH